jgi:hypothetical protein
MTTVAGAAADAKKEQPSAALARRGEDVNDPLNAGDVDLADDLRRFNQVLLRVAHVVVP